MEQNTKLTLIDIKVSRTVKRDLDLIIIELEKKYIIDQRFKYTFAINWLLNTRRLSK